MLSYVGAGPSGSEVRATSDITGIVPLATDDDVLVQEAATRVYRGTVGGTVTELTALEGHGWPLVGDPAADLWSAAPSGSVDHYDGATWARLFVHAGTTSGVARTATDTWAIVGGQVYHWDGGTTWSAASGITGVDTIVAGYGSDAIAYASTALGTPTLAVYDGVGWTSGSVPTSSTLLCAGAAAPGAALVVTLARGVWRFEGGSFALVGSVGGLANACGVRNGRAWGTAFDTAGTAGYFDGTSSFPAQTGLVGSFPPRTQTVVVGPGGRSWIIDDPNGVVEWRP